MKIAIIGTGNLGVSIAEGILKQSAFEVESLILTKRSVNSLVDFKKHKNVNLTSDNVQAVQHSEVVIVAVQPNQLAAVLEEIQPTLDAERHLLISVVTGRKIDEIESIVGREIAVVRAMPNTAISVGESMTCLSANSSAGGAMSKAASIFNALGKTTVIEERLMQAATIICASGIAFWMRLIRATAQGAVQLGFHSDQAQELAMQTSLGAASLLIQSGNHPEQEIDKVTTPSGCTIEGLNEMEHQGLSSSIIKGLVSSFNKINQI